MYLFLVLIAFTISDFFLQKKERVAEENVERQVFAYIYLIQQLIKIDADNIEAQLELAQQAVADEDWELAAEMARKTLAVQPLIAEPYRVLGQASMAEDQRADAIRAYEALSLLDQTDPAETHFRLGSLLQEEGQLLAAQQELAKACEEAPRYRAALKKLLEVNRMLQDQQTPAEEKKE